MFNCKWKFLRDAINCLSFVVLFVIVILALIAKTEYVIADGSNHSIVTTEKLYENSLPLKIEADAVVHTVRRTIAYGHVVIENDQYHITTQYTSYDRLENTITLNGEITMNDKTGKGLYHADKAIISLKSNSIEMQNVIGQIMHKGYFSAKKISSSNGKTYNAEMITASLCNACNNGNTTPLWQLRAKEMEIITDSDDNIKFKNIYLDIWNKQVFFLPYLVTPGINSNGKTGFLMPGLKYNNRFETSATIPFYWKVRDNFDLVFTQSVGKRPTYHLNMRYKTSSGGYDFSIGVMQLPKLSKQHILQQLKTHPMSVNISSNFYYGNSENIAQKCSKKNTLLPKNKLRAYEFGTQGNIAFGDALFLLSQRDEKNKSILIGQVYGNAVYDENFISSKMMYLHNLKRTTKIIVAPTIDIYRIAPVTVSPYIKSLLNQNNTKLVTHITINNLYDDDFSNSINDIAAEIGMLTEMILPYGYKFSYKPGILMYAMRQATQRRDNFTSNNQSYQKIQPKIDMKLSWPLLNTNISGNKDLSRWSMIFEPQLMLKLKSKLHYYDDIDDVITSLNLRPTTDSLNPNSVFSNGLYDTDIRSVNTPSNSLYYGFMMGYYNTKCTDSDKNIGKCSVDKKLTCIVAGKYDINTDFNDDNAFLKTIYNNNRIKRTNLSIARSQKQYIQKYVMQLSWEANGLLLQNRTWFVNSEKPMLDNNELYLNKNFRKVTLDLKHLYFNKTTHFYQKKQVYNNLVKAGLSYNVNSNWSLSLGYGAKFGTNEMHELIGKLRDMKMKVEYVNDCAIIGFTLKRYFSRRDDKLSTSYKMYFKIPDMK